MRLFGTGSVVDRNIVSDNRGAGVMVTVAASQNRITRNSIYANGTGSTTGQLASTCSPRERPEDRDASVRDPQRRRRRRHRSERAAQHPRARDLGRRLRAADGHRVRSAGVDRGAVHRGYRPDRLRGRKDLDRDLRRGIGGRHGRDDRQLRTWSGQPDPAGTRHDQPVPVHLPCPVRSDSRLAAHRDRDARERDLGVQRARDDGPGSHHGSRPRTPTEMRFSRSSGASRHDRTHLPGRRGRRPRRRRRRPRGHRGDRCERRVHDARDSGPALGGGGLPHADAGSLTRTPASLWAEQTIGRPARCADGSGGTAARQRRARASAGAVAESSDDASALPTSSTSRRRTPRAETGRGTTAFSFNVVT